MIYNIINKIKWPDESDSRDPWMFGNKRYSENSGVKCYVGLLLCVEMDWIAGLFSID